MRQKVKVTLDIFDLQGEGIHVFVPAFVNSIPIKLLVDTGASRTIFDLNFIREKLGHILYEQVKEDVHGFNPGSNELYMATLPDVYFSTANIHRPQVRLLDLSHVNSIYKHLDILPIQGIMGSDWLQTCRAVIDYSTGKLKLKIPLMEDEAEQNMLLDITIPETQDTPETSETDQ